MTSSPDMIDAAAGNVAPVPGGSPAGGGADVHAAAALERQAIVVNLGRRALAPPDVSVLLQDASSLMAQALDAKYFGVTELRPDSDQLIVRIGQAQAGEDESIRTVDVPDTLITEALAAAHPLVMRNIGTYQHPADDLLADLGIRSGIVCPLMNGSHCFGALSVYDTRPRRFPQGDVLFAESIAHLMTTTLSRQWAEQALAEQQQLGNAMFDGMESPVVILSPDGCIRQINAACQQITGFEPATIVDRGFASTFLLPEEASPVRDALAGVSPNAGPARFECFLLTRDGSRRRIAWSFSPLAHGGEVSALVGTGVDVTRQQQALEQLSRAENAAAKAKQSLAELKARIDERELTFCAKSGQPVVAEIPQSNRRGQQRQPYPYLQFIAPVQRGELPDRCAFREVRCRDISSSGFSYFANEVPDCKQVVVAFGTHPSVIYLIADVIHVTPFVHKGHRVSLVGCCYVSRARY